MGSRAITYFVAAGGKLQLHFDEKISLENLEQQMLLARQQKRTHFWRLPKEEKS